MNIKKIFASAMSLTLLGTSFPAAQSFCFDSFKAVAADSDSEVDEKFVVYPEDKEVNAGDTVTVNIMCENGSNRKAGQFVAQVINDNLPVAGATATMSSLRCTAVETKPEYKNINGTWYCDTLDSGEPQEINTDKPVAKFDITIPANAKSGTYEWKLDRFHVVENGYDAVEFDAVLKTGKLTVKGGQSTSSDSEVDEKFIVKPEDKEVNAGDTVTVGIYAENGSNRKAGQFVAQVINANLPISGATATMTSLRCTAVATKPEYKNINGTWYCDTLDSGEPQEIDTDKPVAKFDITVPATAKAGTYEWKLDRFHVVENGYDAVEFDAVLKTGKLTVKGGQSDISDGDIDEKFIVKPEDKEVNAGDTVTVGIYAENGSNRKAGQFVAQVINANLPIAGATATMTSLRCTAVATKPEYKNINGTWYCDTLDSGEPQEIDTSKPVAKFDITIPADAKAGTYEWKLDRFHVVENGYEAVEFNANLQTGKLIVKSSGNEDDFLLGDVNFDGKVDAKDASLILVAYSKASTGGDYGFTDKQKKAAEVNGDGKIDAKDASAILAYYAMASTATGTVPTLEDYLKNNK